MSSLSEVVVFTDTNIDTHFALSVSPDITAADFKRELEQTHLFFFPTLGEIKVHEVMVRRKSCFYHLSESLPIKYAFQGSKGSWFLHVGVQPSNCFSKPIFSPGSKVDGSRTTDSFDAHTKGMITTKGVLGTEPVIEEFSLIVPDLDRIQDCSNINEENTGERVVPQIVQHTKPVFGSTSSISADKTLEKREPEALPAKHVFCLEGNSSDFNILTRIHDSQSSMAITSIAPENQLDKQLKGKMGINYSKEQVSPLPEIGVAVRTPPRRISLPRQGNPANNLKTPVRVGRRIVTATNNLRASQNKQSPVISLYKLRVSCDMPSVPRLAVFEISDNDD